mgnify:CR=1 FL=1
MKLISLHNRDKIFHTLKEDIYLHLYSIGDLDDFFWPFTQWYALHDEDHILEIALLYFGQPPPTLLALSPTPERMKVLLEKMAGLLPPSFYAHLSPGLDEALSPAFKARHHGQHIKMALRQTSEWPEDNQERVKKIPESALEDVLAFYQTSYPGNWFDPRMLQTDQYFGIRQEKDLISVAGVHVYSPHYKVAALGNIATHPDHRNRGLATLVTAVLCRSLSKKVKHVGLNVKESNQPAFHCYQKLGFESVARYHEWTFQRT